ncbi:hypothetical protein ALQ16_200922 [Pseudomonas syringae pv. actinidiae]|nr:hypothetical protein ALQ16_200922 [Pseudomonas syringae pv. actinidiae]RMS50571.1 hypothetical protein ALP64_201262 [Pseudomonas syringae pv. actinidiae]
MLASQLDLLDAGVQIGGQLANLLDNLCGALLDVGDHLPDLPGSAGGSTGEPAHLIRNHGKATSMFARPGSFNGGVERQ